MPNIDWATLINWIVFGAITFCFGYATEWVRHRHEMSKLETDLRLNLRESDIKHSTEVRDTVWRKLQTAFRSATFMLRSLRSEFSIDSATRELTETQNHVNELNDYLAISSIYLPADLRDMFFKASQCLVRVVITFDLCIKSASPLKPAYDEYEKTTALVKQIEDSLRENILTH